ncbi:MAG: DinB family protein [Acidobacteria bacterium]|nr:DinB family protein [Acidobacteriota bacterium]
MPPNRTRPARSARSFITPPFVPGLYFSTEVGTSMRNVSRTCSMVAVLVLVTALGARAQSKPGDLKADVLKDWTAMKNTMVKIANEMPEDKFGYKSTPPQRAYGEQILHAATVNVSFMGLLGGKTTAPAINMKATSKAEIVKALSDSFDYGTALINEQTPESMTQAVPARFLGEASRARIAYFVIGHTWDIYGQMVVYLRLSGGVPPASQRP